MKLTLEEKRNVENRPGCPEHSKRVPVLSVYVKMNVIDVQVDKVTKLVKSNKYNSRRAKVDWNETEKVSWTESFSWIQIHEHELEKPFILMVYRLPVRAERRRLYRPYPFR